MESSKNFSATLFKALGYVFFFAVFTYVGMTVTYYIKFDKGILGEEDFQFIDSFYVVVILFASINLIVSGIFILIGNLIQKATDVEIHLKSIAVDFGFTEKIVKNFSTENSQAESESETEELSESGSGESLIVNNEPEAPEPKSEQVEPVTDQ
tara:strand:- start:23 stop:481 length:459 start_codon:yes stop_codon:yes gene_type:complete